MRFAFHPAVMAAFVAGATASTTLAVAQTPTPTMAAPPPITKADQQMSRVLDALAALDPKPIETLEPAEARKQPTMTTAVLKLMKDRGMSVAPEPVGDIDKRSIPGPAGDVPVRVYKPAGAGPFPVIVYVHGGGWVIATLDTYDASCRALTNQAGVVVVSVDYRMAPEHKFPAAHDDVYAVTQWVLKNAAEVGGDPTRVAVAGESAGGNMAAAACLMAKDRNGMQPKHQLLIYPVANYAMDSESQQKNADAKPLNKAMLRWFYGHYLPNPSDGDNKYFSLVRASKDDLTGLPPATVITAEIDPLMSEGKAYADKLKEAGVDVAYQNYDGVTHEFFGAATVIDKAKEAQQFAAKRLVAAFGK